MENKLIKTIKINFGIKNKINVSNLKNMLIAKSSFGITANQKFVFILGGLIFDNK